MVRFRRSVRGILAVILAMGDSEKLTTLAAHPKNGKCHLKLKNEMKTLGRTKGGGWIYLGNCSPQKLFFYLGDMFGSGNLVKIAS